LSQAKGNEGPFSLVAKLGVIHHAGNQEDRKDVIRAHAAARQDHILSERQPHGSRQYPASAYVDLGAGRE
jgi:hypothetical protein